MSTALRIVVEILTGCAVLYLLGAFAAADFNIANWHELARLLVAAGGGFIAYVAIAASTLR